MLRLILQIDKYCDLTRDDLIVGRPDGGERRDEEVACVRCIVVLGNFGKSRGAADECDRVGKNDECDRQMNDQELRGGDHERCDDEHGVLLVLDDGGETVRDDDMLLRLECDCELERDGDGWMLLLGVGGRAILVLGRDLGVGDRGSLLEHELLDLDHVLLENLTAACSLNLTAAKCGSCRVYLSATARYYLSASSRCYLSASARCYLSAVER